jgi:hypothetical protein
VEGNVFRGNTREALSTYGLVIPEDSPNTSPEGDWELDGFANLGARKSSVLQLCNRIALLDVTVTPAVLTLFTSLSSVSAY